MGRAILGAVAGYLVMAFVVMIGITAAWYVLGPAAVFRGEGPEVTTLWTVLCLLLGLPAATRGGWVAARTGKLSARNAVRFLVGLILVLGVVSGVFQLKAQDEGLTATHEPVESLSFVEAGERARQPAWYLLVLPWTGAIGALFGGSIVTKELP